MNYRDGSAHVPVLLSEVINSIAPFDGGIYIDMTFGAGGHTKAMLDACMCNVFAIDRDREVEQHYNAISGIYGKRLSFRVGCMSNIASIADMDDLKSVDGVVCDLGISSMQIERSERGFSFRRDGDLDMRMGVGCSFTAYDVVNSFSESKLANILFEYGEETRSRVIARAIVTARGKRPISSTCELAQIVRDRVSRASKIDSATKTFMAIRMCVNDELQEAYRGIMSCARLLNKGARIAVITFHATEDRVVKHAFSSLCGVVAGDSEKSGGFRLVNKKKIKPSSEELRMNPRSRSAGLRVIERF